ncbi:MAG: DedA family protein, partial [Betaproteobacteria bacterium]|nr:DedA family protein [Betaproteobacteria bacterium]
IDWWMGYGAHTALNRFRKQANDAYHTRALQWLHRLGPKACLLSWLPGIGDPLCAVAGWLKLPFWPCLAYMAIGKCLRYITMTAGLLWLFPSP